jgi:hypothetical protein
LVGLVDLVEFSESFVENGLLVSGLPFSKFRLVSLELILIPQESLLARHGDLIVELTLS